MQQKSGDMSALKDPDHHVGIENLSEIYVPCLIPALRWVTFFLLVREGSILFRLDVVGVNYTNKDTMGAGQFCLSIKPLNAYYVEFSMPVPSHLGSLKPKWVLLYSF